MSSTDELIASPSASHGSPPLTDSKCRLMSLKWCSEYLPRKFDCPFITINSFVSCYFSRLFWTPGFSGCLGISIPVKIFVSPDCQRKFEFYHIRTSSECMYRFIAYFFAWKTVMCWPRGWDMSCLGFPLYPNYPVSPGSSPGDYYFNNFSPS